ncbi:MAG TPA: 4-(cytidine 5'-diphospho)-2-C-methyl-D-erythritol kinase [Chitinophagaceae bacterium]|jgi:4-diphosphocytidyl-2-C-methyl-D-erythritol kinase|nr:4-(cytidine 5'-diphospho)-2-C-methyl-D-erythritol kinase [Chitinophagaceae bacterium]
MIVFPNCKINLGLSVLYKRSDGYHDLETIFYPLPLTDSLEIIENRQFKNPSFPFSSSGLPVAGNPASNLCVKAYRLLKKDFPGLPPLLIHLHKVIPSGAGLGGGSADAAFALQVINKIGKLELSNERLMQYAAELGSDCPFFIVNKPCFARGRGEILEEIELDLSAYRLVIVNPGIHVDTGRAFLDIQPAAPEKTLKEIIAGPAERWKDELCNDFEKVIFPQHRRIVDIKDRFYTKGAVYASMSGSGSTVFGLFAKDKVPVFDFPKDYFIKFF